MGVPIPQLGFSIRAKAQVFCRHDVEKRQVTDIMADPRFEKVHMCPCCQNLFTKRDDIPGPCTRCGGPIRIYGPDGRLISG